MQVESVDKLVTFDDNRRLPRPASTPASTFQRTVLGALEEDIRAGRHKQLHAEEDEISRADGSKSSGMPASSTLKTRVASSSRRTMREAVRAAIAREKADRDSNVRQREEESLNELKRNRRQEVAEYEMSLKRAREEDERRWQLTTQAKRDAVAKKLKQELAEAQEHQIRAIEALDSEREEQRRRMVDEREALASSIDELKKAKALAEKELSSAQSEVEHANAEAMRQASETREVQGALSGLEYEKGYAENDLTELRRSLSAMQDDIATHERSRQSLEGDVAALREERQGLQSELVEARSSLVATKDEVSVQLSRSTEMEQEVEDLRQQLEEARGFRSLEKKVTDLETQRDSLNKTLSDLEKDVALQRSASSSLTEEVARLREGKAQLETTLDQELTEAKQGHSRAMETLEKERVCAAEGLAALREEHEGNATRMMNERAELESFLGSLQAERASIQVQVDELTSSLAQLSREEASMRQGIDERVECEVLRITNERCRSERAKLDARHAKLEEDLSHKAAERVKQKEKTELRKMERTLAQQRIKEEVALAEDLRRMKDEAEAHVRKQKKAWMHELQQEKAEARRKNPLKRCCVLNLSDLVLWTRTEVIVIK